MLVYGIWRLFVFTMLGCLVYVISASWWGYYTSVVMIPHGLSFRAKVCHRNGLRSLDGLWFSHELCWHILIDWCRSRGIALLQLRWYPGNDVLRPGYQDSSAAYPRECWRFVTSSLRVRWPFEFTSASAHTLSVLPSIWCFYERTNYTFFADQHAPTARGCELRGGEFC